MVEEIVPGGLPMLLLAVGIALSIAEALAPGAHLIVLGVALIVAGLVGLLLAEIGLLGGLGLSLVLALTVLLTGAVSLFVYREFDFYGGKGTARTSDSSSLRGMSGRVTERVTPTSGVVKLDQGGFNPHYQARSMGDEIPEGAEVIVADPGGGNVLTVAALDGLDEIDRELAAAAEKAARDAEEDTGGQEGDSDPDQERERERA